MNKNFNITQYLIKINKNGNYNLIRDITQNDKSYTANMISINPSTNEIATTFSFSSYTFFLLVVNTNGKISTNVVFQGGQQQFFIQSIFYF